MNEELQSTNQEMETINEQLHQRNEAFNQVNAFLSAILESISGGVVVLDSQLRIMVWNLKSEDLWGLRSSEVQNQHFLNLDIGLPVEMLSRPIRQSLSDRNSKEEVVLPARNRRGKDISCQVMITPLVGLQENIEGVILVMDEVESPAKKKV
jgi:two-component system CheB/CheR fusion protein